MQEEKESFWRKKGFYISACTLLVAVMAVGTIYYGQTKSDNDNELLADIATEMPETDTKESGTDEKAAQTNAGVASNVQTQESVSKKKEKTATLKEKTEKKKQKTKTVSKQETKAVTASTNIVKHSFNEEKGLLWPVSGDVVLKYSMSNTVYFKTLAQYRCNPGIVISAEKGTNVKAAANCTVTKIEKNDELGTVVTTDIGNNYSVLYGQLDDISVNKGDELKEGDVIGTIAAPTKYYTVEGSNLYFQVKQGKESVDPLLLLR